MNEQNFKFIDTPRGKVKAYIQDDGSTVSFLCINIPKNINKPQEISVRKNPNEGILLFILGLTLFMAALCAFSYLFTMLICYIFNIQLN